MLLQRQSEESALGAQPALSALVPLSPSAPRSRPPPGPSASPRPACVSRLSSLHRTPACKGARKGQSEPPAHPDAQMDISFLLGSRVRENTVLRLFQNFPGANASRPASHLTPCAATAGSLTPCPARCSHPVTVCTSVFLSNS